MTFTTAHNESVNGFDSQISTTDLISGLEALELAGDAGWHPANTDPADQLAAFTDGQGIGASNLYGLLNDFPGDGLPTKRVEFDLGSTKDIGRINLLTGNKSPDGRIFSTSFIEYSTDGLSFTDLGYFQSDPSGTINNIESPASFDPVQRATLVSIFDDAGEPLASSVRYLRFEFFGVDNTGGEMRDPFSGVNTFTGIDDGYTTPNTSPLVFEIDVLEHEDAAPGDYNFDGQVDGIDYAVWRESLGSTTELAADGNGNNMIDDGDFAIWLSNYGAGAPGPAAADLAPEPTALVGMTLALWLAASQRASRRAVRSIG